MTPWRRPQELLRLAGLSQGGFRSAADASFSEGLFYATMCADGRFPWQPTDDLPTRQQALDSRGAGSRRDRPVRKLGDGARAGGYCVDWPSPSGNAPLAAGPLPDVPVLAISGSIDMRTPTTNASSVVSLFPQGHLLVVPGVGHSVLTTDPSGCAEKAVQLWLGRRSPTRCRAPPYLADVPRIPASVTAAPLAPRTSGVRGRTLSVVTTTVQDALATEIAAGEADRRADGRRRASSGLSTLVLAKYSDVAGVAVSGSLHLKRATKGSFLVPVGSVTVAGPKTAAHGVVTFSTGGVKVVWSK